VDHDLEGADGRVGEQGGDRVAQNRAGPERLVLLWQLAAETAAASGRYDQSRRQHASSPASAPRAYRAQSRDSTMPQKAALLASVAALR
jgi:hypothetical protein